MAIVRNAIINWVKCDQNNPDMGYDGDTPQWTVDIENPTKETKKIWKDEKLGGMKTRKASGQEYLVLKRKATPFKNGDEKEAPTIVDAHLKPLDPNIVGNGSIANVQYSVYSWEHKGRKGRSADLSGIQVINLVTREGSVSEFEIIDDIENLMDSNVEDNDNVF